MDIALLALAYKTGLVPDEVRAQRPVVAEIPFEPERRFAAVAYSADGVLRIAVKGALEAVLPFCRTMKTSSGDAPVDQTLVTQQVENLAASGYRVLALADGEVSAETDLAALAASPAALLALCGLAGFIDPLRPDAKEAVAEARKAGVKVVMITGDHPATALAIARQLEIASSEEEVFTGRELAACSATDTPEFHERLRRIRVFARVTPEQKLCIVDGLMRLGEFVAVTGDGVNDAPALHRANIGVAMGSGTEVAKDAAQIIVTDDSFASIVSGIEEGRYAYANVRKVTLFLISTGFAELLLIGSSILLGLPVPFLAVQLLWLNLVTNGIQDVALAFEAGERGVMRLPPRSPKEGIFNRKMIEQVLLGGFTMAVVCLAVYLHLLGKGLEMAEVRNDLLLLMIVLQFFHALNCRSEYRSVFRVPVRNNPVLIGGMALAFLVHLAAMHLPAARHLLGLAPLPIGQWAFFTGIAVCLLAVMELYKWRCRGNGACLL